MKKIRLSAILCFSFLLFSIFRSIPASAQTQASLPLQISVSFAPKNGERIVFLGNSIFENDLQYGYLETAFTTRWPDRDVTYRNIGWTGDNVRGDARGDFTNPPTAYDQLLQQITDTKPTLVFIAYGGTEAEEGEAGLPRFGKALNQLLDTISRLGASAVLLSPIPILQADSSESVAKRNAMLKVYASEISKTAAARGYRYIDILNPLLDIRKTESLTDNGIHLNETGYYHLASVMEKALGLPAPQTSIDINVSKQGVTAAAPVKMMDSLKSDNFSFTIKENYLPLPLPMENSNIPARVIRITGLKKGFYSLAENNAQVITASAQQWEQGVAVKQGATFDQSAKLRDMIVKKNEVFFGKYRPLNRTYILGFRAYEQGKHVKGLEDMELIIKWLEGQIALNRLPKPTVYQLSKLN